MAKATNDGKNGFHKFEEACDDIWVYKLMESYQTINLEVEKHTQKRLTVPNFVISPDVSKKWGSWHQSSRKMMFSGALLRNFEWKAVEHVMRHEIAHQIVSEIFNMDCYGVSHGEAFKRACLIVDIEPRRCESADFLHSFKGTGSSPMVEKVQKLMIKANDESVPEKEAELFMRKAKELMFRHDIEVKDVMGSERVWVKRPFGPNFKRFPQYMHDLGRLLNSHYNVQHIQTYGPDRTKRLELFGEPSNLDIAEYVGHALLNQAEHLYSEYKKESAKEDAKKRLEAKEEGRYYRKYSRISKRSFMEGLVSGYTSKLHASSNQARENVEMSFAKDKAESEGKEYVDGDRTIIPTYDVGLMKEMYGNAYPNMRTTRSAGSRGVGRGAGHSAGSSLTLSRGVRGSGSKGSLLTA